MEGGKGGEEREREREPVSCLADIFVQCKCSQTTAAQKQS